MRNLQQALMAGERVLAAWMQTDSLSVAQIYSAIAEDGLAYDVVIADLEHAAIHDKDFAAIGHTLRGGAVHLGARVRRGHTDKISFAIDMGAKLIIAPMIETAGQARDLVMFANLPPVGVRGVGWAPYNDIGLRIGAVTDTINDQIAVVAQIETVAGIENAEAILAVEGIHAGFIGPYDLSRSWEARGQGKCGELDSPIMRESYERFVQACKVNGKSPGLHIVKPDKTVVAKSIEQGFRLLALSMDTASVIEIGQTMLRSVAQAVASQHK